MLVGVIVLSGPLHELGLVVLSVLVMVWSCVLAVVFVRHRPLAYVLVCGATIGCVYSV